MFIARCKHIVPGGRLIASRLVALTITLSFIATLVPIAIASTNKSSTMPCCVGKDAGHCESGIPAQKVSLPEPEPMCGLTTPPAENDGITIIAEPSHKESHHSLSQTAESGLSNAETSSSQSAAESITLSQPCHTDCCACVSGLARNMRERGTTHSNLLRTLPSRNLAYLEAKVNLFLSNRGWEQTSSRGPPLSLLNS
jgi:hypothetical protein